MDLGRRALGVGARDELDGERKRGSEDRRGGDLGGELVLKRLDRSVMMECRDSLNVILSEEDRRDASSELGWRKTW